MPFIAMRDHERFKVGDRVEVIDDISHYYQSHIGTITSEQQRPMAVVQECDVRLADGTCSRFFDFQLHIPKAITAGIVFDSATSPPVSEACRNRAGRHLRFAVGDFAVHIKVAASDGHKTLLGQVNSVGALPESPLVTLLLQNEPQRTTAANSCGEFIFPRAPLGNVSLELFIPGRRIIVAFDVGSIG
jgi:hypothetical protein